MGLDVHPEFQTRPLPHPEPAVCRVRRAREACSETLMDIAGLDLSMKPGTPPCRTPDYWLGVLQGVTAYLLITMEEADAATR